MSSRAVDPRTPVLVGGGQYAHHAAGLDDALDPVSLMCEAIERARVSAGLATLPDPETLAVVQLHSWRYGDPARVAAERLHVAPRETAISATGGNSPQTLVNLMAASIQAGERDLVVLTGAEAWRTRMRARKEGATLQWPKAPPGQRPSILGAEIEMNHPEENARGINTPVQIYPMFETAIRARLGRTPEEHLRASSEMWSQFSAVAATNPNAWSQVERSAEEIRTPTATNRMIGYPYTKYMNSNNDVDMGAALIMCSAGRAQALGIARDRWVFIHAGTDCHEHQFVSNRWTFDRTPAIELGGAHALGLARMEIDDIDIIDLYSCFPSAVQLGANSLGFALDRQLTRTGGLAFAGGPWNNYVMHAIATVIDELRAGAGANALVWANGGFATKHAFGVYSTRPPAAGFRHASPQQEIDAMPRRDLASPTDAAGVVSIEAYTVMHDRDGRADSVAAACLLADSRRAWGVSTDRGLAAAMCDGEWVGRAARLDDAGALLV